jgi:perosamine synthetase
MIPSARPQLGRKERRAVARVLRSGMLAQGPEVGTFEEEFSQALVSGNHVVAVNSGTSALHLSLLASDIGPGDEVIVPSFTFAATANAVALTGAIPIFVDIDPVSFTLDAKLIEDAITPRTRAIMPVHLYGHPANMPSIFAICQRHDLLLLEDAAQAHGAEWGGKKVGTWGVAGSFSLYPTKNMMSGEGGMVSTSDEGIARKIRLLRNQGQEQRYKNEIVGLNNRMTDIHAAIGRVQLQKLPKWTQRRRQIAAIYDQELRGVTTPVAAKEVTHVYHQYTLRITHGERDRFAKELHNHGIGTGVYYPTPVHLLPAFNQGQYLPETERAARECLSIPVYPALKNREIEKIVETINRLIRAGA